MKKNNDNAEKKKKAIETIKNVAFCRKNKNNVEFEFIVKTPDGESPSIGFGKYEANCDELKKAFQLNPGQNEQFKITMTIEVTNTKRTKNQYHDLLQHFLSRPLLRKAPVPDVVQVIEDKHKETLEFISNESKNIQDNFNEVAGKHNQNDEEIKYFNTETLAAAFLKDPRNTLQKGKKTYVKRAFSLPGAPKIKDGVSVSDFITYINEIGYKCSDAWILKYKEKHKG